jgi:hypothetical protein
MGESLEALGEEDVVGTEGHGDHRQITMASIRPFWNYFNCARRTLCGIGIARPRNEPA